MYNPKQLLLFCEPLYKKGHEVIYANRVQNGRIPYVIEDIREVQGFIEYKVNNLWWRESNLVLFTNEIADKFK
jgi:hypothetical protein